MSHFVSDMLGNHDENPDDQQLLKRIRAGDVHAFELLFRRYFEPLWRFAYRYVRADDIAEDIVQEVFARIWERRAQWRVAGDVKTYLFRAVRNQTINVHKHYLVENRVFDTSDVGIGRIGDTAPLPDEVTLRAQVHQLVDMLPEPRRSAVLLRYYEGLGFQEIALILGISTGAAEMLTARAIRSLRERL
jgi:RNA polymerase sigma-70 factor (ECF subfamily)